MTTTMTCSEAILDTQIRKHYADLEYSCPPPPVCTAWWTTDDWICYITKHGKWGTNERQTT